MNAYQHLIEMCLEAMKANESIFGVIPDAKLDDFPYGAEQAGKPLEELAKRIANEWATHYEEKFVYQFKGHCKGKLDGKTLKEVSEQLPYSEYTKKHMCTNIGFSIETILCEMYKCQRRGESMDKAYMGRMLLRKGKMEPNLMSKNPCKACGEQIKTTINMETNIIAPAKVLRYNGEQRPVFIDCPECPKEANVKSYSVEIDVPSGKLVVGNAISRLLTDDEKCGSNQYQFEKSGVKMMSINYDWGKKLNSDFYAEKLNMVYMPASNQTCTGFLDKTTNVVTYKSDVAYDDDEMEVSTKKMNETKVGYVCCDLWAVTAVDYDHFAALCERMGETIEEGLGIVTSGHVLDLGAGRYRFTSHYFEANPDDINEETLFTIEKVVADKLY